MKPLAMLLLAAGATLQADPGSALMEKLYAKLAASFSSGHALGQGGDYLLLANPGIPISAADCADGYAIALVADQIPLPALTYKPSGSFYSVTYGDILNKAEASNFENQADRAKALKARRAMSDRTRPGQPTPAYAAYLKYQAAWCAAQDTLNLAQTENKATGKKVPAGLDHAVAEALQEWETKGNRKQFDDAAADLDKFYNESVHALFTLLNDDYEGARRNDGHPSEWYPVAATPPPETWMADADWKPFSLTQAEKSLAQGTGSLPKAAKDGKAAQAPDDVAATASITLETKRVNLARPWLDQGVFTSHGWRLQATGGVSKVSSGNPSDADPGIMPLLVTGVLLSRKLVVKGQWHATSVKALGPFSLSGAKTTTDGQSTLSAESPQIIGFFCTTVPKSPDPDAKAFRTK